ncbi:MAG: tetratricopeptide repeat protein [Acidobacteria bacterium]|nr:tetratricopeptide repeat protein [Acidobacteriota bacterium]
MDSSACSECHANVAKTYRLAGMARTFHRPSEQTVIEDFKQANRFVHEASGLTYTMIDRDGKFYIRRSAIGFDGKEANVLEQQIDYVVGSGNHARAYLHRTEQGRLVELPINWYLEKNGSWNMSPGFDQPDQPDMHGAVSSECIFCHTAYPLADDRKTKDDEEVFPATLPEGIDCQRCHGPGAAHIAAARAKASDDRISETIVNPNKLSRERQLEVCMECHLETSARHIPNSIRNYDRDLNSYRPGKPLADYKTYLERSKDANDFGFETAHASYQLPQSACFQKSQMTCLTCHDPHDIPRGEAATRSYVEVCQSCHASTIDLAKDSAHKGVVIKTGSNCLTCHMPKRRPEASVHVVLTDHWIQRRLPPGDLQAPIAEKAFVPNRTKVGIYYPKPATRSDVDLYLAVAQVNDAGVDGTGNLRAILDREHPKWPEPYVTLGKAYAHAGQTDAAVKAFQQALDRRAEDHDALEGMANVLLAADRQDEAIAMLERGARRYVNDDRFPLKLGNTYFRQGKIPEAQDALHKTLAVNPENAEAYNLLGLCGVRSGDTRDAEQNFREAIRLEPLLPGPHNNLATLLVGRQEFREAEFQFRRALALNPQYADAHHGLGLLLILTKRGDAAGTELESAAAEAPGSAQIWVDLGDLRSAQRRSTDAAAAYERALSINPSQQDANLALGLILLEQGKRKDAVLHLTMAAQGADPDVGRQAQSILVQVGR